MPIGSVLHQDSPATIGTLPLTAFGGHPNGSATTPNDTPYIEALNRALQLEQAAVALYAAKQRSSKATGRSGAVALDRADSHHKALRQLVRLIFAQRGFPDSDPAGLTAFTGTVAARVSRYMPPVVQDPVLGVSAQRVEFALARRYRQVLTLAPETDRSTIMQLLEQTTAYSDRL
jgi:hypothetical protein